MPDFTATAKCGDWDGTASADNGASTSLHKYLHEHSFIGDNEFLVAASVTVSKQSTRLSAFVYPGVKRFDSARASIANTRGPVQVRKIDIPLPLNEFVKLFNQ